MSKAPEKIPNLSGKIIKGKYRLEEVLGEGAYGVTYRATDLDLRTSVAVKFLKSANINDQSWKTEAQKAARVRDHPNIVFVQDVGDDTIDTSSGKVWLPFVVWEYVKGKTLGSFLQEQPNITSDVIVEFTNQMCSAIKAMQEVDMEHGDLHENNIMLISPQSYESQAEYRIKIIDFGVSRTLRGLEFSDDIKSLCKILRRFWELNNTYSGEMITSDKRFGRLLASLIKKMEDQSVESKLFDPIGIIQAIQRMREQASLDKVDEKLKLNNPFEYLSAEEIPEGTDLIPELFSDKLPWFREIQDFGTVLICGPRGCGKSMVLKSMSFKTKMSSTNFRVSEFKQQKFVGFYVHCHSSIYMPLSKRNVQYNREILDNIFHYLNLLIAHEIVDTLIKAENNRVIIISDYAKKELFNFINGFLQERGIAITRVDLLELTRSLIEKETKLIQRCIRENRPLSKLTEVSFLKDICDILVRTIDYFRQRKIYFLIDDYSHPNVDFAIQRHFNRIIRFRNNVFCFKISSEKFAMEMKDSDGKVLEPQSEYHYVDLGAKFISYPYGGALRVFIKDIIDRRLKRSGIDSQIDNLLGTYSFPGKDVGASLANPETRKSTKYCGFNTVYMLCSGDIRTFLELCKAIYDEACRRGWNVNSGKPIPFNIQDGVITRFSRMYLGNVKAYEGGDSLFRIANAFGFICQRYLYDYGSITKDQPERYYEIIRIEITDLGRMVDEAARIYKDLIRYSIFTDAGEGYPVGNMLPTRIVLRRIYAPAFRISYRNRESLRLSPERFENFLKEPETFKKSGTEFLKKLADTSQKELTPFMKKDYSKEEEYELENNL